MVGFIFLDNGRAGSLHYRVGAFMHVFQVLARVGLRSQLCHAPLLGLRSARQQDRSSTWLRLSTKSSICKYVMRCVGCELAVSVGFHMLGDSQQLARVHDALPAFAVGKWLAFTMQSQHFAVRKRVIAAPM
jgi:hypothetical protein